MNISGIVYQLLASHLLVLTIGIFLLFKTFFLGKKTNKKKWIGACIFDLVLTLIMLGFTIRTTVAVYDPEVLYHEGYFLEEHATVHNGPLPFTWRYTFSNDSGKRPIFYLDTFSRKEIVPDGFKQGEKYRICYDDYSNIILKVEKLEE